MRKFILYTILFLTPFIVTIITMEYLLRGIPNSHMAKANAMKTELPQIKILILGNSHAASGLNPKYFSKKAYNLAQGAQTLDVDYHLLDKYKNKLDSLEYVIVPISYHSLWFKLSELRYYSWMAKYNNIYFGINIEHNPLKRFLILDNPIRVQLKDIKNYYGEKKPQKPHSTDGFIAVPPTKMSVLEISESGKSKAETFSVDNLNYLYEENLNYLLAIIDIAQNKGAKVIFVTIPCYSTYIDNLKTNQLALMHQTMNKLQNGKSVFYLDLLEDGRKLSVQDFSDGDHLSYIGAEKTTIKVDSILTSIESAN